MKSFTSLIAAMSYAAIRRQQGISAAVHTKDSNGLYWVYS